MHYNHDCPKRTALWSSNPKVLNFNKGALTAGFKSKQRATHGHVRLVTRTIGKDGKEKFTGNRALKGTQKHGLSYVGIVRARLLFLQLLRDVKPRSKPYKP